MRPRFTADPTIAKSVRDARVSAKLTQKELAQQMAQQGHGFVQQTVHKIEIAARSVSPEEAVVMSALLGINILVDAESASVMQSAATRAAVIKARADIEQIKALVDGLDRFLDSVEEEISNEGNAGDGPSPDRRGNCA